MGLSAIICLSITCDWYFEGAGVGGVIQNSRIILISVCLNNPFLDWYILLILDSILLLFLRFAMFLSVNTAFYKPCRQD